MFNELNCSQAHTNSRLAWCACQSSKFYPFLEVSFSLLPTNLSLSMDTTTWGWLDGNHQFGVVICSRNCHNQWKNFKISCRSFLLSEEMIGTIIDYSLLHRLECHGGSPVYTLFFQKCLRIHISIGENILLRISFLKPCTCICYNKLIFHLFLSIVKSWMYPKIFYLHVSLFFDLGS